MNEVQVNERSEALRYSVAVGIVALSLLARVALDPVLQDELPFVTFFVGIAAAAWFGGLGPSLLSVALGFVAAEWFFIGHGHAQLLATPRDFAMAGCYFLVAAIIVLLGNAIHKARECAASRQAELEREIGKRRRAEEELRGAQDELEYRIRVRTAELSGAMEAQEAEKKALAHKSAELERSNAELQQFAYAASHDLQEPLRMVANFTQLLAERYASRLDDDGREFIAYAVGGAARMQALIQDLLAYSRVGAKGRGFEPVNCNEAFGRAVSNLYASIGESAALVSHDELPVIQADATQMVQVFQNLVGNGIKFKGADPPRVHVSAVRNADDWVFSVRDNGIGIEPRYAERIFVIFQRLHRPEDYPGNGIGLALCRKIVERHGGEIWLESQPGQGSTFFFSIPVDGQRTGSANGKHGNE
jgi:signal transduction histidine kinase